MDAVSVFGRIRRKVKIKVKRDHKGAQVAVTLRGRPFAFNHPQREPTSVPVRVPERLDGAKLNVGGGKGHPKLDGWAIVDLRESSADVILDISRDPLPYPDDSVALIFCSHTLEHIERGRLNFVLSEFHRVLRPGNGLVRIAVPDIEVAVRAYLDRDYAFFATSDVGQADPDAPLGGLLASWFYSTRPDTKHGYGHVHCFDYEYLKAWLRDAGFQHIWRSAYRQSALPELRGDAFDRHPNDSVFVEAAK